MLLPSFQMVRWFKMATSGSVVCQSMVVTPVGLKEMAKLGSPSNSIMTCYAPIVRHSIQQSKSCLPPLGWEALWKTRSLSSIHFSLCLTIYTHGKWIRWCHTSWTTAWQMLHNATWWMITRTIAGRCRMKSYLGILFLNSRWSRNGPALWLKNSTSTRQT